MNFVEFREFFKGEGFGRGYGNTNFSTCLIFPMIYTIERVGLNSSFRI